MAEMTTKQRVAICAECKHMMGPFGGSEHPRYLCGAVQPKTRLNYVTGKTTVTPRSEMASAQCYNHNRDGKCKDFEEQSC